MPRPSAFKQPKRAKPGTQPSDRLRRYTSASMSIQGRDRRDTTVGPGAGLATVADVDAKVQVKEEDDHALTYHGRRPLAIAVELYELRWDTGRQEFVFQAPRGPLRILGLQEDEPPDPVFVGDDEDVFIDAGEPDAQEP